MSAPRSLLLVGRLRPERKRSLTGMAIAAELPLVAIEEATDALAWLDSSDPGCVIVDAGIARLDKVIGRIRSKRELAHVPIFALVTTPDDLWIEQYYAWGGDDVMHMDAGATLLERLRTVPREVPKPVANRRALIAEPDRVRREVLSRVFSLAGFEVRTELETRALQGVIEKFEPTLVLANSAMGDLASVISQVRKTRSTATWAVLAARRELESQQTVFAEVPGVFVAGVQSNPWQLLARANEVGRVAVPERRREPRRPFGSFVLFRAAGSDEDDVGIAYNLSSGGMFVRTYAPVQAAEVWLEWRVPQDKTRVRVQGRVVWRQASLTDSARAASPLGFGIEFCDYLGGARKQIEQALEVLDTSSRRGAGVAAPSSGRKSLSGSAPAVVRLESPRPVSLEPDAWESEADGALARSASPQANDDSRPPTRAIGDTPSDVTSPESELRRPPAPPSSVMATGRLPPRPNVPPRPASAPLPALGPAGEPFAEEVAPETRDFLSGPRTPRGGMSAPGAPRIGSLPKPASASSAAGGQVGTSTIVGLGAPPAAWLPTDSQASAALKSSGIDGPRGAEPSGGRSADDDPSSSDRTEILSNPTALFEIAADSIPPMQDETDDAPTVVTSPIIDSSATAADTKAALSPTGSGPTATESRFGADELETRRWSGSGAPGQNAEQDPASPAPFFVSARANSRAGSGKLIIGAGLVVLAGIAATAYWLSNGQPQRANQALDLSARVEPQLGVPSTASAASAVPAASVVPAPSAVPAASVVPAPSAVSSGEGEPVVLPVASSTKTTPGEIPLAPLDDGTALDGYPPVEEFQMGKGRLLADRYGYLVVRFPEAAFIFANGIAMGATNWKIATTCGEKTLRIGVGEKPVTWLSDEMRVNVVCRDTTRVVFRKLPGVTAPPGVQRPMLPGSSPARKNARPEAEPQATESVKAVPGGVDQANSPAPNAPIPEPHSTPQPGQPEDRAAERPAGGVVDTRE